MKTLTLWQLADRSGAIATPTDRRDRREVVSNQVEIDIGIEGEKSILVKLDECFQKRQIGTREYHAGVDKLLAVYLRYDPNHSVVIPEFVGHE